MKRALLWVYNWITVIVTAFLGSATLILQALAFFDGVDITPFVGPETALKVVTGVAILKAILSVIENMMRREE
jgi:hypothetical protein